MSAEELQEVVGIEHATALLSFARGRRLHVPVRPTADHPITLLIGCRAADRLCEVYGGDVIEFGTGQPPGRKPNPAAELVRRGRASGKTIQELSAAYDLSPRQIYRLLAGAVTQCHPEQSGGTR